MKLLIVDDHPMVRKGLRTMLDCSEEGFEIFESGTINEALSTLRKENPQIVLVDVKLGEENGLDILQKGKSISKECKYIILSGCISKMEFLKAEEYGAYGYILKDAYSEDILYAIKTVARGKKYYDSGVISYSRNDTLPKLFNQLTEREREALLEIGNGLSNAEIAKKFYITESTVKKHVSSILSKLNLSHRSQVIKLIYSTNIDYKEDSYQ